MPTCCASASTGARVSDVPRHDLLLPELPRDLPGGVAQQRRELGRPFDRPVLT